MAAALVGVRLEVGWEHDAQPAARDVAEADVEAVEVAPRCEEDPEGHIGDVRRRRQHLPKARAGGARREGWGLGPGVWGLRVWGLGLGVWVWGRGRGFV